MRQADYKGLPLTILEEGETVQGAIILCVRQDEQAVPRDGRAPAACGGCGDGVWLHAKSTEVAPGARIICGRCFEKMLSKEIN